MFYGNKIDISKRLCSICNKNRNEIYNNKIYICIKCNMNLCPLCRLTHNINSHKIINYDKRNYICNKHNDNYIKYCCNKNICMECENDHKNHNSIYFGDILPNINDDNVKEYLDKLNNEIKFIIEKFTVKTE